MEYPFSFRTSASGAQVFGRIELYPGAEVASSPITPIPTVWWLRPDNSAALVGAHSEVVWNLVYLSPVSAKLSKTGVFTGPPNVCDAPNPPSSSSTTSTFGAPSGGRSGLIGGNEVSGSFASYVVNRAPIRDREYPSLHLLAHLDRWGPTYPGMAAAYRNMDYVSVAFASDPDKAAALIPTELELINIPALGGQAAANLVFAKYRECDLGPYMEVIVSIPVLHKGQIYAYVPAIYVDNDAALLAGREIGGYPKKLAQITMRNYGNLFLSHMARGAIQKKTDDPNFTDLASSSVTKGGKLLSVPLPADNTIGLPPPYNLLLPLPPPTGEPQDYVITTMALRRFPGIGQDPTAPPVPKCSSS